MTGKGTKAECSDSDDNKPVEPDTVDTVEPIIEHSEPIEDDTEQKKEESVKQPEV